jgi:parallel beta-helix repeat protein
LGEANFGTPPTLNVVVSGNTFQTDTSCGCYVGADPADWSVILSQNLESVSVSQNTILGGGSAGVAVFGGPGMVSGNTIANSYVGVWLNDSRGVQVTGNTIKNSATWGIAVTNVSSNNLIARNIVMGSGAYDLYWDQTGTGNVWCGNLYHTSSPSVLPSC